MRRETPFSPFWALPVSIPVHRLEPSCLHYKLSLKIWVKYDGFVDSCLGNEVLQGIHYTTSWRLMLKYCKTHGVSRRNLTWNMLWRSSTGCKPHNAPEGQIWNGNYWSQWWHRENRELGNTQPSWKRSEMGRRQESWISNKSSAPLLPF